MLWQFSMQLKAFLAEKNVLVEIFVNTCKMLKLTSYLWLQVCRKSIDLTPGRFAQDRKIVGKIFCTSTSIYHSRGFRSKVVMVVWLTECNDIGSNLFAKTSFNQCQRTRENIWMEIENDPWMCCVGLIAYLWTLEQNLPMKVAFVDVKWPDSEWTSLVTSQLLFFWAWLFLW